MASGVVGASDAARRTGLSALAQLTAALAQAETVDQVCQRGLEVVERLLGAERGSVLLFDEEGVMRFRAWTGLSDAYRAATEGHSPWGPGTLDAAPVVVEDVLQDPSLEPLRDVILAEGIRALAFVPISLERRVIGKYMLYFSEPRALAEEELQLAGIVADQIAIAVKRQRDEDAVRAAREQLQAIFGSVADGVTVQRPDGELVYANHAAARFLGFETPEQLLETPLSEIMGRFDVYTEQGEAVAVEQLPGRRVLAGEPAAEQLVRYRNRETGQERSSLVKASPVYDELGGVRFVVNVVEDVTEERRRQLWQELFADASSLLGESLVSDETLERVASLAVPTIADWCAVSVPGAGRPRLVALAHRDAERRQTALDLVERYPADPEGEGGTAWVLRTGSSVLVEHVTDEMLAAAARDEEHLRLLRALDLRSAMIVPLTARGRTLAAIVFATSGGQRTYGPEDLALAEEFARRVALVVDNAELFERVEFQRGLLEAQSEAVVDGLLVVGPGGEILSYNRRFVEIWQISEDSLAAGDDAALSEAVELLLDPHAFLERVRELYERREASREEIRFRDGRTIERYGVPLVGPGGSYDGYLWSFRDITERKRIEEALATALERERQARLRAELLERNAARLAAAVSARDVAAAAVGDLQEVGFPVVALVLRRGERMEVTASRGMAQDMIDRADGKPVTADMAVAEAMRTGELIEFEKGEEYDARYASGAELRRLYPLETMVAVPIRAADGRVLGSLYAASYEPSWLTADRRQLLLGVVEQCGLALERAELFEAEHEVALTLQRSLLPQCLPARGAVELAAVYRPGSRGLNVGGDWYDAVELPDGRIALAIGDVVGHGLGAATVMGELRMSMRPYFLDGLPPDEVLRRLNALVVGTDDRTAIGQAFATAAAAVLDADAGRIELASAGHPPPVLVGPGGASFLDVPAGPPVGALDDASYSSTAYRLDPGSTLVLYTDGLVERRGRPLEAGLGVLLETASKGDDLAPDELCGDLVRALVGDEETADDLALLTVRISAAPGFRRRLRARPTELAPLRHALRSWLERIGMDEDVAYDVVLAASEACANAIEHPLERRSRFVDVEALLVEGAVQVRVHDSGRWREPGPPRLRGRGLRLIESFMDDVRIDQAAEGTVVVMRRDFRPKS